MTVKEHWKEDINSVFFDTDEFAEMHRVNGKEMPCVIDGYEMIERAAKYKSEYDDGLYAKRILMYVRAVDFGALPAIGRRVMVDAKAYTVADAVDEGGAYSLTLELIKSGVDRGIGGL